MPAWAVGIASRIGFTGLAIAVLLALLAVQTVRLEGFKVWPISVEGALPKIQRYEQALKDIERTTRETTAKWREAIRAKEQQYRNLAQEADHNAEQAHSDALAAADRYIAAHRFVCPGNQGGVDRPSANPGGGNPGVPATLPADSFVAVRDADVRACSAATAYAVEAHNWAVGIAAAGK